MNDIERELIELNQAIMDLTVKGNGASCLTASQKRIKSMLVSTGNGNDTVIVNQGNCNEQKCEPCPPGPPGPKGDTGDTGPIGPTGEQGIKGDTGETGATGATGEKGPKGDKGDTGEQGIQGETGATGPQGIKGDKGDKGDKGECDDHNCITISEDYDVKEDDFYIGVHSEGPVTITLPKSKSCSVLIVKCEMGAPIGNRKVTIKATNGKKIDGNNTRVLQSPYESIQLIYNNNWYSIS